MQDKELYMTAAKIFCAETRLDEETGHYKLHVVMIGMTKDLRYRHKTFGPSYDLSDPGDLEQIKWLQRAIGVEELVLPEEDLKDKWLRAIVEKTPKGEYEPRAFGYNGTDLFYIHNGDGKELTEGEVTKIVIES